jgi:hypothetical protein
VLIESVVAKANVLLSAVTGEAALLVSTEHDLTDHVAQFTVGEVPEYIPPIARK